MSAGWFRVPTWCMATHDEPKSQDARAWIYLLGAWANGHDPSLREICRVTGFGGGRATALFEDARAWAKENGAPYRDGRRATHGIPGPLFDGEFEDPGPLSHADIVQRAVAWLRGKHQCRIVFAELVTFAPVIPDAWGLRRGRWSVLVEAKTSRSDFRADKKKPIHTSPDTCPGQERWYLTPPGLIRADEVPDGWGLAECGKRTVRIVVPSPRVEHERTMREGFAYPVNMAVPLIPGRMQADLLLLSGAMRRHQIGVEWDNEIARFAAYGSTPAGEAK